MAAAATAITEHLFQGLREVYPRCHEQFIPSIKQQFPSARVQPLFSSSQRNLLKQSSIIKPITTQKRTMAFFPRNFYNVDSSSFTPLFRLLDDFDNYSRNNSVRQPGVPTWQPKFDIRETSEFYELCGDLPGISKDQVQIEFTDPQTMLVRGRVERSYSAGTPPTGRIEDVSHSGTITEGGESKNSHKATVEDEEAAEQSRPVSEEAVDKKPAGKKAGDSKWWLTERSVGEFSRSFNFPSRIEQDNVTANFKDGVLTVVVPKAKKHESRRIAIN